jgi:hypothetical protein
MAEDRRMTRRLAGLLNARRREARLWAVADPRKARGKRWKRLEVLLEAAMVGIVAGCKSTRDVEALTDEMSVPMRRLLHIPRRIPDTTLRTVLMATDPQELRQSLYAQVRAAHRRKALQAMGLPFGQVSIDGKATAIGAWDERYSQRQQHSVGPGASGVARTLTAALVSGRATVCLDAAPIPPATNEMGQFKTALAELMAAYGTLDLFRVISGDAGLCSEANAREVKRYGLDYLFALKDQPTLLREAKHLIGRRRAAETETVDIVGKTTVTRRLFTTTELAGFLSWEHLQTVVRVQSVKRDLETNEVLEREDRYFLSSLARETLSDEQWLRLVRNHWWVENGCHQIWDKIFREDERPWIKSGEGSCQGTVVVMMLRRLGFNLLALYRGVTQRSEERRQTPWRDLMRKVYNTLIAATEADTQALRQRRALAASVT